MFSQRQPPADSIPEPINDLLLPCRISDTHFSESGGSVRVRPEPDETVCFFVIDDQSKQSPPDCKLRQALEMPQGAICDLIVFYARQGEARRILCLTELKGGRLKDAVEQVMNTFHYLSRSCGNPCLQQITWKAYIYLHGSCPRHDVKQQRPRLEQVFGRGKCDVKHNPDLGQFLRK